MCFCVQEVENVHVLLAAILHVTNIQFKEYEHSTAGEVVVDNEDSLNKGNACQIELN
jgi:myosin heavy subunit